MLAFTVAVIGVAAGLISALVVGCKFPHGTIPTALTGIIGGFVGLLAARLLHLRGTNDSFELLWAILGAIAVLSLWHTLLRDRLR